MSDFLNKYPPDVSLPMAGGGRLNVADWRGNIVVLTFWSVECPWSRRADLLLVYRAAAWNAQGVRVLGVAANANETENSILLEKEARHVRYPIALDWGGKVAAAFRAEVTPYFFVFDRKGLVRYAGALDDATFKRPRPKKLYLDLAVTALLHDLTPDPAFTLPYGSSIVRYVAEDSGDASLTVKP